MLKQTAGNVLTTLQAKSSPVKRIVHLGVDISNDITSGQRYSSLVGFFAQKWGTQGERATASCLWAIWEDGSNNNYVKLIMVI